MGKFNEFCQGYLRILKGAEMEEIPDLVLFRPLAYLGVRLVAPTGITPNQVTIASIFFGIAGGVLAWMGTDASLAWAAVMVLLFNVLDCMDGMLARTRGTSSPFGYVLDGLAGYIGTFAIIIGIAHTVASRHHQPFEWWVLTIAAGISLAWWCAVVDGLRGEWMRIVHGRRRERAAELAALVAEAEEWRRQGTHRANRFLVGCYVAYVRVWSLDSAANGGAVVERDPPAEVWIPLNKPIMRMALLGGPTMQLLVIILALAFDRLEWFLWVTVLWGNAWAAMVLLIRAGVRRRLAAAVLEEA